jgi:hypothetical protein
MRLANPLLDEVEDFLLAGGEDFAIPFHFGNQAALLLENLSQDTAQKARCQDVQYPFR